LYVICRLIEASIQRVALFQNTNLDRYYTPNTRILCPEYFEQVLRVKNNVKKNKLGDHLLVKVGADNDGRGPWGLEELYARIAGVIRAEDHVGILRDRNCYIIFSQAGPSNAAAILTRLAQLGIASQVVSGQYPPSPEAPEQAVFTSTAESN
jgi:hypothetical protein